MASTAPPSFSDLSTDFVILEVGNEQKRHLVHRDLLIHASPYFKAMFSGQWKESSITEPVKLAEADHRIFPIFLDWLYFRRFPQIVRGPTDTCFICGEKREPPHSRDCAAGEVQDVEVLSPEEDAEVEAVLSRIDRRFWFTHLYIFADKFDVPALREELINKRWRDVLSKTRSPQLSYAIVINAYRHLSSSSPLCRLIMDTFVGHWTAKEHREQYCAIEQKLRAKFPTSFLHALAARLAEKLHENQSTGNTIRPLCHYHEHAQDIAARTICTDKMMNRASLERKDNFDWAGLELVRARSDGGPKQK